MIVLAADTSGKQGSLSLARCTREGTCDPLEVVALKGGTFSAQLVPQINELLLRHGLTKKDMDAFAVVSGPGSFTGLRVGLAAIKGLAEVLNKPIAAVSLLEAVVVASKAEGRTVAVLDAGRAEVYVGEYDKAQDCRKLHERLLLVEEWLAVSSGSTIVSPDSSVLDLARAAGLQVEAIERPGSDLIAAIGWRKITSGETVSPEMLEANYIRRSDAEIFSKSGLSKTSP